MKHPRRTFLGAALAAGAGSFLPRRLPAASTATPNRLGMFISLGADPDRTLKQVADLGLTACEIYTEAFGDDLRRS